MKKLILTVIAGLGLSLFAYANSDQSVKGVWVPVEGELVFYTLEQVIETQ